MKPKMQNAQTQLKLLLDEHELTQGMYVRVHGDHLIAGREETFEPDGKPVKADRVRFTRLSASSYGLSVKRHTGRWERTPFSGSLRQMMDAVLSFMQHLVAPY